MQNGQKVRELNIGLYKNNKKFMSNNYRISRNVWKPFTFTINTGLTGVSNINQFELPLKSSISYISGGSLTPDYRFKVDWGDGAIENFTTFNQVGRTHSYTASGTYSIKIYGRCDGLDYSSPSDASKIISIDSWGNVVWRSLANSLSNSTNIISVTSSSPVFEKVTKLDRMFESSSLTQSDLNSWNISKVDSLRRTFYFCESLKKLEISNWDVSNVTTMRDTFNSCGITSFDGSLWNTYNLTSTRSMFAGCTSLSNFNAPNWNLINLTDMTGMFSGCGLTYFGVNQWTASSVSSINNLFSFSSLQEVDLSGITFSSSLNNIGQLFQGCSNLISATISSVLDNTSVNSFFLTFALCSNLTKMDFVNWNTSNIVSFQSAFASCIGLTAINSSNWNVSNVVTFNSSFLSCTSLIDIDVSNWDVSNVTDMTAMFQSANSLTQINCGGWTVSSLTSAGFMFSNVTLTTTSYDNLLKGWVGWTGGIGGTASKPVQSNVAFDAGYSQYTTGSEAASARNYLISVKGWTITDGGWI